MTGQANSVPPADIPNVPQPAPGRPCWRRRFPPPHRRHDAAVPCRRARRSKPRRPVRPGEVALAPGARFGRDAPQIIIGGLHWRIYADKPDQSGAFRLVKEDRSAQPTFVLPRRRLHRARQLRAGAARRSRCSCAASRCARCSRFRPAGCRSRAGRRRAASRPAQISFDIYKGSQFEPGERRPIAIERVDRRRRAGARGHLLHPVEIRRRQRGGALRHPRAGRQAHRHDGDASRRGDHVQAGEPQRRRGARQHRLGGAFAGRRHHQGIEGRVSARDPGRGRIQA